MEDPGWAGRVRATGDKAHPREVYRSGADSGSGTPRVRPNPRGTYTLVGPLLGRTETFCGQAEEYSVGGHDTQTQPQDGADYNSRHAPQGRGLQLPSDPTGR